MGLDIYLYRYENLEQTERKEKEYNEYSESLWKDKKWDELLQEEKDDINEKLNNRALSLGLTKWGIDETTCKSIKEHSELYPEHMFKIGYFRSSYNEGGIERILRNFGLPTLHDIFGNPNEYKFQPDWESALNKTLDTIEKLKEKGSYRVHHVSKNIFSDENNIKNSKDALDAFLKETEKKHEFNYDTSIGEIAVHQPMKVLALLPGTHELLGERDCIYVITESDNTWYINALEIVVETCRYVLSKEDKELYYLHWSG